MDWSDAARGRRYAPESNDGSSYISSSSSSTTRRQGPLTTVFSSPPVPQAQTQVQPPQYRRSVNHPIYGDSKMANGTESSSTNTSPSDTRSPMSRSPDQGDRTGQNDLPNGDLIYHMLHFSDPWFIFTIILHVIIFSLLISMSRRHLSSGTTSAFSLLVIFTVILLFIGRRNLKKVKKGFQKKTLTKVSTRLKRG